MFLDFLYPEIEKVPFEEIEKQVNRFYSLAIKRRIGFGDHDDMAQIKSAVKSRLYFP
ncbi:MAG: hypothetical protein QN650_08860 [Nitrososphaeraceae archaeon]|nr:hypothetical protein [Nitrososphaeraceae archaeon]